MKKIYAGRMTQRVYCIVYECGEKKILKKKEERMLED